MIQIRHQRRGGTVSTRSGGQSDTTVVDTCRIHFGSLDWIGNTSGGRSAPGGLDRLRGKVSSWNIWLGHKNEQHKKASEQVSKRNSQPYCYFKACGRPGGNPRTAPAGAAATRGAVGVPAMPIPRRRPCRSSARPSIGSTRWYPRPWTRTGPSGPAATAAVAAPIRTMPVVVMPLAPRRTKRREQTILLLLAAAEVLAEL